jgi:hypothetical protein
MTSNNATKIYVKLSKKAHRSNYSNFNFPVTCVFKSYPHDPKALTGEKKSFYR